MSFTDIDDRRERRVSHKMMVAIVLLSGMGFMSDCRSGCISSFI